ncbi:hypothetical protein FRC05_011463 [Tulasnella sp. 425]|nr:hypothetical protein FRC05_011463 [Tulasnella sp. 425]
MGESSFRFSDGHAKSRYHLNQIPQEQPFLRGSLTMTIGRACYGQALSRRFAKNRSTVINAPPHYAHRNHRPTTLYELIEDSQKYSKEGGRYDVGEVNYYRHINPLFRRMYMNSWTNFNLTKATDLAGPAFSSTTLTLLILAPATQKLEKEFSPASVLLLLKCILSSSLLPNTPPQIVIQKTLRSARSKLICIGFLVLVATKVEKWNSVHSQLSGSGSVTPKFLRQPRQGHASKLEDRQAEPVALIVLDIVLWRHARYHLKDETKIGNPACSCVENAK